MYGSDDNSMLETETDPFSSFGGGDAKINDSSELIILFKWDGDSNNLIEDVDYFLWGLSYPRINKTNIYTYLDDTPTENQLYFETEAESNYAYSRIGIDEIGEIEAGGNGISSHDETSENFRQSWRISPLFNLGCTDETASNYDSDAEKNDGSCEYFETESIYDIIHNCGDAVGESLECNGKYDLSSASAGECPLYEESITTSGIIVDYFDITPFDGPHSFTIESQDGYRIDFVVWPESSSYQDGFDITTTDLNILTGNFGTYKVQITGELGAYCDDDELLDINSEWQVTVEYESDITIVTSTGCTADGNVNGDGGVNILDVVQIVSYVLGTLDFSDSQICSADLNGDDVVNILGLPATTKRKSHGIS